MPFLPTEPVLAVELILILAGCFLLWRQVLRPEVRQIRPALGTWDIPVPLFLLFLWLVISLGLLAQFAAVHALRSTDWGETATLIVAGGALQLGMLLGVAVFLLIFNRGAEGNGNGNRRPGVLLSGLVTFLIILPVISATSLAWKGVLWSVGVEAEPQDLIGMFAETKSLPLLAAMILLATVVAPVTEEMVFRAGLFRYLRTRIPRWAAYVLPTGIFAALHGNLASLLPLAVLGFIFAYAYERTGRIAVPIIAHGLFNLNTIILIFAGATA